MSLAGGTAVVLMDGDARHFLTCPPAAERVLALTPAARAVLLAGGVDATASTSTFTDEHHAACVEGVAEAVKAFLPALNAHPELGPATRHILLNNYYNMGYLAYLAWHMLDHDGPWILPTASGWKAHPNRVDAHAALLANILKSGHQVRPLTYRPPPLAGLFRSIRSACLSALRARGPWAVTGPGKMRFDLRRFFAKSAPALRQCAVQPATQGNFQEYFNLAWSSANILLGRHDVIHIPSLPSEAALKMVEDREALIGTLLSGQSDKVIEGALAVVKEALARNLALLGAFVEDEREIVRKLRPTAFFSFEANEPSSTLLAESCAAEQVPRIIMNHNSMTVTERPAATEMMENLTLRRVANRLADVSWCWSPHVARVRLRNQRAGKPIAIQPVRVYAHIASRHGKTKPGDEDFRILHADNYTGFDIFLPWVSHTSEEYLEAIHDFGRTVKDLPGIRLDIRVRPKPECNLQTARALLPDLEANLTGYERPFLEHLQDSDLLVSFMSTTIEQALQLRVPVLLWGATRRHLHLPARTTPPTPDDRASVYAARNKDDLPPMLEAIQKAHHGMPLRDEELKQHVWPAETPTIPQMVAQIARGEYGRSVEVAGRT